MKKIAIILTIITSYIASSQSLSLFDIDTTSFPTIKAKFFAFDVNGNQITNLSPSSFELVENGQTRTVASVSCPAPQPPVALSSVLTIDVSGSMSGYRINHAKEAAKDWVEGLPLGKSECALTTFNSNNYFNQDFTTDKNKLLNAINFLNSRGSTDFDAGFINKMAGAFLAAEKGKYKKVVVFLTDGHATGNESAIIQKAKQINATVYCVTLDLPCPEILKNIAEETGGQWFENITTVAQARQTYQNILQYAQGGEPCEIEWESRISCTSGITNVELTLLPNGAIAKTSYHIPNTSIAKLEFNPTYLKFKNPAIGVTEEQKVTVTAINADYNVSNIILNNNQYTVSPSSFLLKNGESKELTISYTAIEKGYTFCKLEFQTDICPATYYVSGGYIGVAPSQKTLEIIKPIAGDIFVVGSDTIITWKGIGESDTVSLEFSIDGGANWKLITNTASGLKYNWKNIPKPATTNCKIRAKQRTKDNSQGEPGTLQFILSGHSDYVRAISWSPDGSRVATASFDNTAIIWDAGTGAKLHTLSGHIGSVYDINWSPDGSRVATASGFYENTGIIWDAETGAKLHTLIGHTSLVETIKWNPDGSRVATSSFDNTAIIWDAETGKKLHTLSGHTGSVYDISWSPDGSRVATASWDKSGIIWDAETGTELHTLGGNTNYNMYDISWSPDGSRVATASEDRTGIIWDAETGEILHTLRGHNHDVRIITWNPDGSRVATASRDRKGGIWDAETGEILHTLGGHADYVYDISWSPDGSRVATASRDNRAIIWDAKTGARLHTLNGHTDVVWDINWSPDGSRVATASYDKTAKIWFVGNSESIIQEDESEIFSIVEPKAQGKAVDMGKLLIGSSKDSVVTDFVQNIGSWKFRVDSIYFQGADANAFSLVSGFPEYIVEANNAHYAEFRFSSQRVGIHNAEIVIITQAEKLVYDITGIGEEEKLQVISNWLDFGEVEISDENTISDTVLIKNISGTLININNVVQLGPDMEQFEIVSGGGSFLLDPNASHKMSIKFKPKYGGRTSGQLGFEYNGTGSPAKVQLFGTGIGGSAYIVDDSAYAGETKNIKLMMGKVKPEGIAAIASNFEAKIRFQRTILGTNSNLDWQISNDSIYVTIKGQIGNTLELASIPVVACLGNLEETTIDLLEMNLIDDLGNKVDYDFETQSGTFKLLGVCYEGGARLLNPSGKAGITDIKPNPAANEITIAVSLIEKGQTEIAIYNIEGEKVSEIYAGEVSTFGTYEFTSDITNLSNGTYYVIFQTPTIKDSQSIMIAR